MRRSLSEKVIFHQYGELQCRHLFGFSNSELQPFSQRRQTVIHPFEVTLAGSHSNLFPPFFFKYCSRLSLSTNHCLPALNPVTSGLNLNSQVICR